jgi:hypothetical protein
MRRNNYGAGPPRQKKESTSAKKRSQKLTKAEAATLEKCQTRSCLVETKLTLWARRQKRIREAAIFNLFVRPVRHRSDAINQAHLEFVRVLKGGAR